MAERDKRSDFLHGFAEEKLVSDLGPLLEEYAEPGPYDILRAIISYYSRNLNSEVRSEIAVVFGDIPNFKSRTFYMVFDEKCVRCHGAKYCWEEHKLEDRFGLTTLICSDNELFKHIMNIEDETGLPITEIQFDHELALKRINYPTLVAYQKRRRFNAFEDGYFAYMQEGRLKIYKRLPISILD